MDFVHLHVHTQFSFLTSTVKLAELAKRTRELGMSAVALTDHTNMFGAVRHYKACLAAGIRPILGCELSVARADGSSNADHLVVLARNIDGYKNLVRLVSQSHLRPKLEGAPSLGLEDFSGRTRRTHGFERLPRRRGSAAGSRVRPGSRRTDAD